ncbi:molybdenum cofactor guanylyltransferase [Sphaerimonospora sp. CA-214678]|uniref:molybdenum cofactor guanylyltransferase n=1 Tax=Sphaerimonospora sp. CA-214678 TaxID=3240029 RepID=UPI003D92C4FF
MNDDARDEIGHDAVILAGGRASRLGGLDKPGTLVGGVPLIEWVAAAVAGARTLVVVGPERTPADSGTSRAVRTRAIFTREDPPGSGPIPALRAGLAEVTAAWVVLLAADLPFLESAHVTALLRRAAAAEAAGAVLVDDGGREQWLTGAWRTAVLTDALRAYTGGSLRGLLGPLGPVPVRLPAGRGGRAPWFDCDTMGDLRTADGLRTAGGTGRERERDEEQA